MLVTPKSLRPQKVVATKTKKTFWSCVVVAVVVDLFFYKNAAVWYLNVDVANFLQFCQPQSNVIFVTQGGNHKGSRRVDFVTSLEQPWCLESPVVLGHQDKHNRGRKRERPYFLVSQILLKLAPSTLPGLKQDCSLNFNDKATSAHCSLLSTHAHRTKR